APSRPPPVEGRSRPRSAGRQAGLVSGAGLRSSSQGVRSSVLAGVETNSIFASLTAVAERRGKVCVLHLVRQGNGVDPFRRFLDSYRRHAAGVDHELVLIFKGFANARSTEPYRSLAADVATSSLNVADVGFDLGSYVDAARTVTFDRLCFVNSFTEVETDDWLGLLVSG